MRCGRLDSGHSPRRHGANVVPSMTDETILTAYVSRQRRGIRTTAPLRGSHRQSQGGHATSRSSNRPVAIRVERRAGVEGGRPPPTRPAETETRMSERSTQGRAADARPPFAWRQRVVGMCGLPALVPQLGIDRP
jgi:hypothetical protein